MSPTVTISNATYARLEALGGGLFTVSEVIERLVSAARPTVAKDPDSPRSSVSAPVSQRESILSMRAPRERGATVEIDGHRIHAGTVSDLYQQAFRLVIQKGKSNELKALAPYRTSNQRYLFALEPKHPNGNDFFSDVTVGPFHVEAHKNYEQAIRQLETLLARLGISFRYLR